MKIHVKDFTDFDTDFVYPCLLQHKRSDNGDDIILAIASDGDFVKAIIIRANNKLAGHYLGFVSERELLKKDYIPFYGEVVLANG